MQVSLRVHAAATSTSTVQRSRRGAVVVRADDKFCRDRVGVRREVQSQGKVYKVTFLARGGDERTIECPDDAYILDAAEKFGIDLPATCRAGICGSCVARVASGTVDQSDIPDLDFTLEPSEQEKGMALLCMARATSDVSVETQSDWGYSLGVGEWKGATGSFTAEVDPLMGDKWGQAKEAEKVSAK